jgi:hypothetical protein
MYVYLSDKYRYANRQTRGMFFFQKLVCKLCICTTESMFFTNILYKLVILLCEGDAKVYKTLQ